MIKQKILENYNHENSNNKNWQRVLDFGAEAITEKMKSQPRKTQASVFIVLP